MQLRNKLRAFAFLSGVLASSCAGGQGGDPGQTNVDAGGTGGTGGAVGGSGGVSGFGGGQSGDGCPAEAQGFGIVSAALDEHRPALRETINLADPATSEPAIRAEGLRRLEDGLITTGYNGFWEIELSKPARKTGVAHDGGVDVAVPSDLDGDGDEDLLTVGIIEGGLQASLWERAGRELVLLESFPMGEHIALGDVDEDGDVDIAGVASSLGLLRNEGAFQFSFIDDNPDLNGACPNCEVEAVLLSDVDDDGALDLAALVDGAAAGKEGIWVAVQRGDGAGTLGEVELSKISDEVRSGRRSKLNGDINGDSYADFVLSVDGDEGPETEVIFGAANGAFLAPQLLDYNIDDALDLDGDGALDLITVETGAVTVRYSRSIDLYEAHRYELALSAGTKVVVERRSAGSTPVIHALYRTGCRSVCSSECASCVFDICLECLNHGDCTSGHCQYGRCLAPQDEDAGAN